jgi:molybdopterin molybdotransferase
LHVRAALDLLEGADPAGAPMFTGVLAAAVKADVRRERLVRMRLDTDGEGRNLLYPLPNQDSHMLSNLSTATVLVRVPSRDAEYVAGEILQWTRL